MRMAAAGLVAVTFVGAAACGGDDDDDGGASSTPEATSEGGGEASGDEQAVEDAVSAVFAAWNAKDVDALVAGFTDTGLLAVFGEEGQTAEEVAADLPLFIGSDRSKAKSSVKPRSMVSRRPRSCSSPWALPTTRASSAW